MTNETLKRAKRIEELLKELNEHKEQIDRLNKTSSDHQIPIYVSLSNRDSRPIGLHDEALPITKNKFICLYVSSIDEEINKLEKELEAL